MPDSYLDFDFPYLGWYDFLQAYWALQGPSELTWSIGQKTLLSLSQA